MRKYHSAPKRNDSLIQAVTGRQNTKKPATKDHMVWDSIYTKYPEETSRWKESRGGRAMARKGGDTSSGVTERLASCDGCTSAGPADRASWLDRTARALDLKEVALKRTSRQASAAAVRGAEFQEEPLWLLANKSKMTLVSPNPDVHQRHCPPSVSVPHRAQLPGSLTLPPVPSFLPAGTLPGHLPPGVSCSLPRPAASSTFAGHTQVSCTRQGAISSLPSAAGMGLAWRGGQELH